MNTHTVCETCPVGTPESFVESMDLSKKVKTGLKKYLGEEVKREAQLRVFFIGIVIHLFGRDKQRLSGDTIWVVHQCLESVWNLGSRNIDCKKHHMAALYEQAGKGPLCLRKYMMEESMSFIKKLWEESSKNEEQFQSQLRDRWPVHQMAFMC